MSVDIENVSFYYGSIRNDLIYDGYLGYYEFILPENIEIGEWFSINILEEYLYKSNEESNGTLFVPGFRLKNMDIFTDYSYKNLNITNGGIRIVGAEPIQTEPLQTELTQTEPPQTESPQIEPLQTESPQTSTSLATSTIIESTTITTTSITTTTNESTVTTTENTTISTTSVTTTSSASSITTTTIPEISEVTENKNDKSKNNLPLILAVLASIGILGGIIGFIIKKAKGNKEK